MNYELEIMYQVYKTVQERENDNGETPERIATVIDDGDYSIERVEEEFEAMMREIKTEDALGVGYSFTPQTVIMNGKLYDFSRIKYWASDDGVTDLVEAINKYEPSHRIKLWEKDI